MQIAGHTEVLNVTLKTCTHYIIYDEGFRDLMYRAKMKYILSDLEGRDRLLGLRKLKKYVGLLAIHHLLNWETENSVE